MNSLKQFLKIGIFFAVGAFVLLSERAVAADCRSDLGGRCTAGWCCTSGDQWCGGEKEEKAPTGTTGCTVIEGCCYSPSCPDLASHCASSCTSGAKAECSTSCTRSGRPSTYCNTPSSSGSGTSGSALNYTPLENLPGFEGQSGDFATYFKNLYLLALWIVGISALFMLVVGGFLYLSSAGNTSLLGTAKKTIYGALIGLVIALISWLLLDTINSDLTNLKLSGLSGAVGTSGTSGGGGGSSGGGNIPEEYKGKGSGCSGAETQAGSHCEDASQDLSDVLKCMVDKLGNKKMQISSISDDYNGGSIFTRCRDNYAQPPCEHGQNSCHYGGSAKKDKSCAADISGSYMSRSGAASASEVKNAASACGAGYVLDEGDHVHLSVSGCGCR